VETEAVRKSVEQPGQEREADNRNCPGHRLSGAAQRFSGLMPALPHLGAIHLCKLHPPARVKIRVDPLGIRQDRRLGSESGYE